MKYIILLFAIITFSYSYAQINSGMIRYKGVIIDSRNDSLLNNSTRSQQLSTFLDKVYKNKEQINYTLKFNLEESLFNYEDPLDIDSSIDKKMALVLMGGNAIYYYKITDSFFLKQIEAYGETFIVQHNNYKWTLEQETKQIGNFLCHKATTYYVVNNSKGTFKHKVTAWYAPQIPISFGPKGFNGLPGIIVQIDIHNARFYLTEVQLNPSEELDIVKPKKGQKVTKEEFEKIGEKLSRRFF